MTGQVSLFMATGRVLRR